MLRLYISWPIAFLAVCAFAALYRAEVDALLRHRRPVAASAALVAAHSSLDLRHQR